MLDLEDERTSLGRALLAPEYTGRSSGIWSVMHLFDSDNHLAGSSIGQYSQVK